MQSKYETGFQKGYNALIVIFDFLMFLDFLRQILNLESRGLWKSGEKKQSINQVYSLTWAFSSKEGTIQKYQKGHV